MSGRAPGFSTGPNGSLTRAGLTATITRVALDGDRLVLTAGAAERIEIAAAEVTRLRVAEYPATARTRGYCETVIERPAGRILLTANRDDVAYGKTVRAFADAVAAAGGAEVLRRGPSLGTALIMMGLVIGSLTFLMAFLVMLALFFGGWWWAPVLLFAPLYLLAWRAQIRQQWPRRVKGPAGLDAVLPPLTGASS